MNGTTELVAAAKAIKIKRSTELEAIWGSLEAGSDAVGLCKKASKISDEAVAMCWRLASMPARSALVAIGGYGRGVLWPQSDVDVMVLADSESAVPEQELEAAVSRLAALLWDAGIEPGLVGRRVGECARLAQEDVTIRCAMMERRLVAGDDSLMSDLAEQIDGLDPLPFYLAKMREQRDRHERHGDSPFGLEPNVKEAPGGLRDLQMPMWIARAMGIEPSWEGLRIAGLLTGGEAELASACDARLSLLRAMLHREAKRRDERLDFAAQAKLAERLGIGMEDGKSAAAVMMDGFFACARSAVMINEVLLQAMSERLVKSEAGPKRELSPRFYEQGGLLWAASDEVFAKEPSALFEAFEWMQRDEGLLGMGSRTTRALWRAGRRVDAWFRADDWNRQAFVRMLKSPRGSVSEIARMARVGLLGAYLPSFGRAETLMQHDLFHAYTVGRHTLGVMRNLRRFAREDRAHELPLMAELAAGFDKFWLMYLGALFHDIAKGRGGRHEEKGVEDAKAFCSQHGIEGDDESLVSFLVLRHLEMSRISQKEDIQDPEVVEAFAKMCGSARRLDALYMMTVADMRATGPTVWNDWKARLLEALWQQARAVLDGEWTGAKGKSSKMKALAKSEAVKAGASLEQAKAYVGALDDLYFLRASAEDCAWHARALARVDRTETSCHVDCDPIGGVKCLVWSQDRRGLFLRICAALAKAGLSVRSAKLASSKSGWALDSFEALDPEGAACSPERSVSIRKAVLSELALAEPSRGASLGRCSARAKQAGSVAQAHMSKAGADWLVEVACADRSGILWTIADEFDRRGLAVKSARVTTVGERAEDVFVVSAPELESPEARLAIESALVSKLAV